MIDHKNKLIFIHIPRTGGTSIERMAGINEDKPDKHHCASEIKSNVSKKIWNEYFKFTVIRHPLARAMSTYKWVRTIKSHPSYTELSFIDWLEYIKREKPRSNSFKSMCKFLDLRDEKITEFSFESSYQSISALFNKDMVDIHKNKTNGIQGMVKFDPTFSIVEASELVFEIYQCDYQRWGFAE